MQNKHEGQKQLSQKEHGEHTNQFAWRWTDTQVHAKEN